MEETEKVLLVKIDPEAMKKLKIMGTHHGLKQGEIIEKIINECWDKTKNQLSKE